MHWLLIAAGGALGTLMRYAIAELSGERLSHAWFPTPTFLANAAGSFLLIWIMVHLEGRELLGVDLRLVLGTGVMGGFTTFSTFNYETLRLLEDGHYARVVVYIAATLATCLLFGGVALVAARALR